MRRSKADVERYVERYMERYISSVQNDKKAGKGFLFAKLYFEAKEYDLAKRHVSEYLTVQLKDPKAHKFLGQLFERDGETDKAVGCYKRSMDLNPAQSDLVLKVAELLCGTPEPDSRAEFWVDKAAMLLPGHPTIFNLREKLLSTRGRIGSNQLYKLLQSELKLRPDDTYINEKLVRLYRAEGRHEEAVKHCLQVEKTGALRDRLEWYELLVSVLQEYLCQPSVASNEQASRKFHKELLLALCSRVRLSLRVKGCEESTEALWSLDRAMQNLKNTATNTLDELSEVFTEMRAQLYLYAGTLLLKMAQDGVQQWRAVLDFAALCYLLAYQAPRPKAKSLKSEHAFHEPLELLASDCQSQAGHMLLNLSQDVEQLLKDVVEAFGNRSGPSHLFDALFGTQKHEQLSFICNDEMHIVNTHPPRAADLAKWDSDAVLLHAGDLQHLAWLGLQWALMEESVSLQLWLKHLFPRLTIETSKLDTNAPESICLLDLEVFLCGVVFSSQTQLQETARMASGSSPLQPRCLPLQIMKLLSSAKQSEWWHAVYSLIHKRALPGTSAKLRLLVQHGLSTLRAGEKHGLQPALLIHWAQHLTDTGERVNSNNGQKEYAGRSVHYWKVVLPLFEKIRSKCIIPEPLEPMFMHFHSKDIQPSQVRVYEEEAVISFATLLDIEGNTDEAIAKLEKLNSISSNWHLAKIYQRLMEEAGNGMEETQDRCTNFLLQSRKYLKKIYQASPEDIDKLPVSMEDVMDLLNEVNQQLSEDGEQNEDQVDYPLTSSPGQPTEAHVKFSTPSPSKSVTSPSKRSVFSPKTPPHWAEDHKSLLQMLCQQVESLQNEVHGLRHNNSSDATAEGLQEGFPGAQASHCVPLTGPYAYYNQSPPYNSQYHLRTAANVTPTKGPVCGMNRLPPQQHMYAYQQSTHTPPLQSTPACIYPQEQVFGGPIRFESPATSSPFSEEDYGHNFPQPTVNPTLPEPGYFTKPSVITATQPSSSSERKAVDPKMGSTGEPPKVPNFGGVAFAPSTSATTAFKFNSSFKSNDGDFTFSSAQMENSESLLGLLTSDIPPKAEGPSDPKHQTQDQPSSQSGVFTFGSKSATGVSFTDGPQSKINISGNSDQRVSFSSGTKPVSGNPEAREEKSGESDNDSTHVEEEEDGPHFEPIVPLPDKVDVKTGEEEEEEMFCRRAKLFRFDAETKEWKERGIGSIKILKHRTSGKVRLLMRREQVLKICANHYINADMVLKPNAGSDKSWVWYAMDYADEMPKTEQLAIRFKTADKAALFKVKFEEAQKFILESPQGQQLEKKCEAPKPQVSSKDMDLKTMFSKKEGEWDCDACCVRNSSTSAVCVACNSAAPSTAKIKPVQELKGSAPVAPPAKLFSFGLTGDSDKITISTDVSSKGLAFGSQKPVSFQFGSNDAPATSVGLGGQADKKTVQADAPQHAKVSAAPALPFGSGFGSKFVKKEGQWDCDSCLVWNDASATECVSCKAPCTTGLAAMFGKKDGQWDCDTCLVINEGTASQCVSCQAANPNMKGKTSTAPSSSSFTFSFGSSSKKPAATGFKANFNPGPAFQFGTSKDEASSEGFKFESSTTQADKSSSSSKSSFSMPVPTGGVKFGIAESETSASDGQSQHGSAPDLLKKIAEHKEKEKQAIPSSSDEPIDTGSHDNDPFITGKPKPFSFADLAKSSQDSSLFSRKDPTFKGFEGAGEQLFTGINSSSVNQVDNMYKTENEDIQFESSLSSKEKSPLLIPSSEENDDIHFEPVVQMPEKFDPAVAVLEETTKERTALPEVESSPKLDVTPGEEFGSQITKTMVSPPKFVFGSDAVQKIFESPLSSKEKSPVLIPSSEENEDIQFKPEDLQKIIGSPLSSKNKSPVLIPSSEENYDIQFEPVVQMSEKVDPAVAVLEETTKERTALPEVESSLKLDEMPGEELGAQITKTVVSPPKFVFGSDSVKIFESPLSSKEKSPVLIPSSEENYDFQFEPVVQMPEKVDPAVAVLEETTKERTALPEVESSPKLDEMPGEELGAQITKTVVSPPKFVFGSGSVKIFESPLSSKEKSPVLIPSSEENEDIQFEPVFQMSEKVDPAVAVHEETTKERTALPEVESSLKLDGKPREELGAQITKTMVSPPKFVFGSDAVQKIFESPLSSKEKSPVLIPSSEENDDIQFKPEDLQKIFESPLSSKKKSPLLIPSSEENHDIQFEPVVQMSEKVDPAVAVLEETTKERTALPEVESSLKLDEMPGEELGAEITKTVVSPPKFFFESDSVKIFESPLSSKEISPVLIPSSEENEDIQFEPVVQMPEKVDPVVAVLEETTIKCTALPEVESSLKLDGKPREELGAQITTFSSPTTSLSFAFAFASVSARVSSFADLAKSSGEFALGKKDPNFLWSNAGATVFGSAPTQNEGEEEGEEEGKR